MDQRTKIGLNLRVGFWGKFFIRFLGGLTQKNEVGF